MGADILLFSDARKIAYHYEFIMDLNTRPAQKDEFIFMGP